ncbi:MAG TPA: SDR family oxidoreductase [Chloroflexota bacterium]|nr:SDR family oxidoreductase [Chloroflexota bacterium]
MILVIGATGTVGHELVPQLLRTGQTVRAMSRTPEKARALFGAGVEVVQGAVDDSAALRAALAGVERLFLLTPPMSGQPPDATVCALAAEAGVRQIVRLSVLAAGGDEHDPLTGWHTAAENAIKASGLAWTFLRPGGFMSNTLGWAETIRRERTVRALFADQQVAWIDPHDIAAVATRVLTEDGHAGRAYLLSGPQALSPREQAAILAAALGTAIEFIDLPPAQVRAAMIAQGMPPARADVVLSARESSAMSLGKTVFPTVEQITGRPPHTYAEWVAAHLDAFR